MSVAHATWALGLGTDSDVGDTNTGDRTFQHAGDANAKGAIVLVQSSATSASCTGVLYGGTAMQLIETCVDTTEAGRIDIYFLGNLSGLTGTQTVTVQGATANSKHVWAATVTAATSQTAIVGNSHLDTQSGANPSITFSLATAGMVYGGLAGGAAAETSYGVGAGETLLGAGPDYGARSGRWSRSTTEAASGNYTFNFSYATSDDWAIAVIAVGEYTPPTQTGTGEVGLGTLGEPATRTSHSIEVRARVQSGAGVLRVALFEGSTNVTGFLSTAALTTSLADYSVAIPDAVAETIGAYNNLRIRWYGYCANGGSIVFEVDKLSLRTPETSGPVTHYGQVVLPLSLSITTAGTRRTTSAVALPLSLGMTTSGSRKTFGTIVVPLSISIATVGTQYKRSSIALALSMDVVTVGKIDAHSAISLPLSVGFTISGKVHAFSSIDLPLTLTIFTNGIRQGVPETYYGSIVLPLDLAIVTSGTRKTFSTVALPLSLGLTTSGTRSTRSAIVLPLVLGVTTSGQRTTRSAVALPLALSITSSGKRTTFSSVALPLTTSIYTKGTLHAYGRVVFPLSLTIVTIGTSQGEVYGSISLPLTLSVTTAGVRTTRSASSLALGVTFVTSGVRVTRGALAFPITVTVATAGKRTTFGTIDLPLTFSVFSEGSVEGQEEGAFSWPWVLTYTVRGQRSKVVSPDATLSTDGSSAFEEGERPGVVQSGGYSVTIKQRES